MSDIVVTPAPIIVVIDGSEPEVVLVQADTLIIDGTDDPQILYVDPDYVIVETSGARGPTGPAGVAGPQNLFIQTTDPGIVPPDTGLWIDTTGGDLSFWVENGI